MWLWQLPIGSGSTTLQYRSLSRLRDPPQRPTGHRSANSARFLLEAAVLGRIIRLDVIIKSVRLRSKSQNLRDLSRLSLVQFIFPEPVVLRLEPGDFLYPRQNAGRHNQASFHVLGRSVVGDDAVDHHQGSTERVGSGGLTCLPSQGSNSPRCLRPVGSYTSTVSCKRSRSMIRPSSVFQRLRRPPPGRGVFARTFCASGKPGSASPPGNRRLTRPVPDAATIPPREAICMTTGYIIVQ